MINEHSVETISLCNVVIVIWFHLEMLQFRKKLFWLLCDEPWRGCIYEYSDYQGGSLSLISAIAK